MNIQSQHWAKTHLLSMCYRIISIRFIFFISCTWKYIPTGLHGVFGSEDGSSIGGMSSIWNMISLLDKKDCNKEKMPVSVASNSSWTPVQPPARKCGNSSWCSCRGTLARVWATKKAEFHMGQWTDVRASWTDALDQILRHYIVFIAFITGSVVSCCRWCLQTKIICNFWCCQCRHRSFALALVPLLLASKRRVIF